VRLHIYNTITPFKGGLIGNIKTLNEKFTKIQDGRSSIKEIA